MLRRLHWLVLRRLPGPFFGWLGTLMFLLTMQFLIRWLPEIAGKGIPTLVIIELIAYNLAYMVVLAVPMSVLLAALMAFGSLAESRYYAVIKSTGISFGQIVWPTLVVSLLLAGGMLYFNHVMLPEANHRARQLWGDIRDKRPGFELRPGVFYDGVKDYSILVRERPSGTNKLTDITIYDYSKGRDQQGVIKAERGRIDSQNEGARLKITLYDGEIHRLLPADATHRTDRYKRLTFDRHRITFKLSNAVFRRSESGEASRTTRTMRTPQLLNTLDSLQHQRRTEARDLYELANEKLIASLSESDSVQSSPSVTRADTVPSHLAFVGLERKSRRSAVRIALNNAQSVKSSIERKARNMNWKTQRIRSHKVELYKKFSIALACFVFMFVGAPLGLTLRRSGLATVGGVALGIFMFYWITLVQGEKLSERGFFPPWFGMWIANIIASGAGIWLLLRVVLDLGATPPLRQRFWNWVTSTES